MLAEVRYQMTSHGIGKYMIYRVVAQGTAEDRFSDEKVISKTEVARSADLKKLDELITHLRHFDGELYYND